MLKVIWELFFCTSFMFIFLLFMSLHDSFPSIWQLCARAGEKSHRFSAATGMRSARLCSQLPHWPTGRMSNRTLCEAQHFRACDKTQFPNGPTHNTGQHFRFSWESEREREREGEQEGASESPRGRVGRRYAGPRQLSAALSEVGNL